MASASDRRIAEGLEHLRLGDKCLKTSLFKWKPDYDDAAAEFTKAATAFKNAKAYERATESYLKAADAQKQVGSAFHAAKSIEAAAMIYKEAKNFDEAADLVEQASALYLEHGVPDTAAISLERAAKMVESEKPDRAITLFKKACDVFEGEDNLHQCAEMTGRAARLCIRHKQFDNAVTTLTKEMQFYSQIDHQGRLPKVVIGLVLVHLHRGDSVAAELALKAAYSHNGFSGSEEASALERLLTAYEEGDEDMATAVTKSPLFCYMENDFCKLARDLKIPGSVAAKSRPSAAPSGGGDESGTAGGDDGEDDDEYAGGLL